MIEVRDLVKRYGNHLAVDHLSFTVEKGEVCGFLGPNGAGKSTTMNIMTGYLSATSGEVLVNGHSMVRQPEAAKQCIGYLPEIPPLYIDMTVQEYLSFAAQLKRIPRGERESSIGQALEMAHLTQVSQRLIRNLSKGYRQRVGLAQAVLGLPEVIILDEPTVGLDPKQIIEIRDVIRSLAGEHTVILSSHILAEVQEVCDHVLIIDHGKLLASGTPEQLEQQLRTSSLELTVKWDDPAAAQALLCRVDGVAGAACVPAGAGQVSARVEVRPGSDPREGIFRAFAQAGRPILMIRPEELSLEQIFLRLTDQDSSVRKEETV